MAKKSSGNKKKTTATQAASLGSKGNSGAVVDKAALNMGEGLLSQFENLSPPTIYCQHHATVGFGSLTPRPNNPNVHPPEQIRLLAKILCQNGFRSPVVVSNRSQLIVKGHGRYEACGLLHAVFGNAMRIPVEYQDYASEADELADVTADNAIAELSYHDPVALASIMAEIEGSYGEGFDFERLGYELPDLEQLRADADAALAEGNGHVLLQLRYENESIEALTPHPQNYKKHPDDQLQHIASMVRQYGIYRSIVVTKDNVILAGHGLVEACKLLGRTRVPVTRMNVDAQHPAALKLLIADNEVGHLGETDDRALSEMLKELHHAQDELGENSLLGTGFDLSMVSALAMVSRPATEMADEQAATSWVGLPEYTDGELVTPCKLIVLCRSQADKEEFIKQYGLENVHALTSKTSSVWFPTREPEKPGAFRFVQTGDEGNDEEGEEGDEEDDFVPARNRGASKAPAPQAEKKKSGRKPALRERRKAKVARKRASK